MKSYGSLFHVDIWWKTPEFLYHYADMSPRGSFIKVLNNSTSRTTLKLLHLKDYAVRTMLRLDGGPFQYKDAVTPVIGFPLQDEMV